MILSCWSQTHSLLQSWSLRKMNLIWNLGNDDQEMEILMDYAGPESKLCVELENEMHVQLVDMR